MKSDFTFAVCAYGDSPYLEEALLSAMHQTVPVEILIATSTPSEYIRNIAEQQADKPEFAQVLLYGQSKNIRKNCKHDQSDRDDYRIS